MITNEVMFGIGFKVVWERGVDKGESDRGRTGNMLLLVGLVAGPWGIIIILF